MAGRIRGEMAPLPRAARAAAVETVLFAALLAVHYAVLIGYDAAEARALTLQHAIGVYLPARAVVAAGAAMAQLVRSRGGFLAAASPSALQDAAAMAAVALAVGAAWAGGDAALEAVAAAPALAARWVTAATGHKDAGALARAAVVEALAYRGSALYYAAVLAAAAAASAIAGAVVAVTARALWRCARAAASTGRAADGGAAASG